MTGIARCAFQRKFDSHCSLITFFAILALASLVSVGPLPTQAQSSDTTQVYSGPVTPANPASTEKFTLTGTVVDSVTGEPIRKALVQLYTAFAYDGPALIPRLKRELLAALDQQGFSTVADAVGADIM